MKRLKVVTFDPVSAQRVAMIHPATPEYALEAERLLNAAEHEPGGEVVQVFTSPSGAVLGALLRVPAA